MSDIEGIDDRKSLRRRAARRVTIAAVILLGFVLAAPLNSYSSLQRIDDNFSLIDGSWALELPARLGRGEIAGRDFVTTYGLLYQVIHALGLLVPPGDFASLYRFHGLIETLLTLLGVWLVLRLTGAPLRWRAAVYLLWASIWPPTHLAGIKPIGGLLLVAICGSALAAPSNTKGRLNSMMTLLLWALTVPLLVLYAFDLGIMALMALILVVLMVLVTCALSPSGSVAIATRRRALLCMTVALLACALSIAGLWLTNGWNQYLQDSWKVVSGYSVTMAVGIEFRDLAVMAVGLCSGVLIIALTCRRLRVSWRDGDAAVRRTLALLAAACFCIIWMRHGLTRSDAGHVVIALIPTLFLIGCLLPCYLRAEHMRLAGAALAVPVLVLVLTIPYYVVTTGLRALGTPPPPFVTWTTQRLEAVRNLQLRGARLEINHNAMREATAVAQGLPGDSLYIWPYETSVNLAAGKLSPNYTLQSYAAHTDYLERATIARMASIPKLPVLVFTDSTAIDGVENLTRTPRIFRYLLERYELASSPHEAFALLQERSQGNQQWQEQDLPVTVGNFSPGDDRSLNVNIPVDAIIDCRASDLLVLRLRAAKTRFFGIGKPGRLSMTFLLSNGEQRTQNLLLPPDDEPHDVLVSASTISDPLFLSIFAPGRLWQSNERVIGLQLKWSRLDILSVSPRIITLDRVSVLRRKDV